MHAAMGDGEVIICGAETPGYARMKTQVVPIEGLPTPFIENDELVAVIASAETVDEAKDVAIHRMLDFLTDVAGMPLNDAAMLMSLVGDLKFCQVVDPLMTVRFEFPKSVLARLRLRDAALGAASCGARRPRSRPAWAAPLVSFHLACCGVQAATLRSGLELGREVPQERRLLDDAVGGQ